MGIGRRNFLKLSSAAMVGLTIDPTQAVITNDNIYINKKMGILFNKPQNWGFINIKDFGKLKDEQILGNGWNDSKDEVWEEIGDPICIATKYHLDLEVHKGVFSPTITLNVTHKSELSDIDFDSYEELLSLSQEGAASILNNFKITEKYKPYILSGCKFHEYDAEYLFEHVELENPILVELKVIKAEHNNFYYDFNCHQSKEQNQVAFKEFEEFKKSIRLI